MNLITNLCNLNGCWCVPDSFILTEGGSSGSPQKHKKRSIPVNPVGHAESKLRRPACATTSPPAQLVLIPLRWLLPTVIMCLLCLVSVYIYILYILDIHIICRILPCAENKIENNYSTAGLETSKYTQALPRVHWHCSAVYIFVAHLFMAWLQG